MKKNYILFLIFVFVFQFGKSQTIVNFDATDASAFVGYMSVDNPDGGFEGGWGVSDLIVNVDEGTNTATLLPNRVNNTDGYWFNDPNDLLGRSTMNASFFAEDQSGTLATAGAIDFVGNISSYTLDNQWTVSAFIKVFEAGFSALLFETYVPITAAGDFSVSYDGTAGGLIVQYGFLTIGPNVNPQPAFDAQWDALGGVVVTAQTLSSDSFEKSEINAYPNPSQSTWNIKSNSSITSIELFDALGRNVLSVNPNDLEVTLDANNLPKGLYFATVTNELGVNTIKLIRE